MATCAALALEVVVILKCIKKCIATTSSTIVFIYVYSIMSFKPFTPFPYNPSYINVDGSNWAGNFTSNIVPQSSLSSLVPESNILAARASALKGGYKKSKKSKKSKYNMRVYNRMKHTHKKYTKGCKKCIRKSRSRSRSRSMNLFPMES